MQGEWEDGIQCRFSLVATFEMAEVGIAIVIVTIGIGMAQILARVA